MLPPIGSQTLLYLLYIQDLVVQQEKDLLIKH